jgi:hypothetical protein
MINVGNILNSPVIEDPWQHKEVKNVFRQNFFQRLSAEVQQVKDHIQVGDNGLWMFEAVQLGISQSLVDEIFEANKQFLKISAQLIKQFNTKNTSQIGYFSIPRFNFVKPNYVGEIHDDGDTKEKTVIMTTYLYPNQSTGTRLYTQEVESSYHSSLNWEPNSALVFAPVTDVTWHSFNSGHSERITLSFFFEKIENMDIINRLSEEKIEWFYNNFAKDIMSIELD